MKTYKQKNEETETILKECKNSNSYNIDQLKDLLNRLKKMRCN